MNVNKFRRQSNASFLVKSNTFNIGVYIDPSKWTFSTRKANEKNPEYTFSMKNQEGYALMVTEKTPIDLESMREIGPAVGPAIIKFALPFFLADRKRAALAILIQRPGFRCFGNRAELRYLAFPSLLVCVRQGIVPCRNAEIGRALEYRKVCRLFGEHRRYLNA